MKVANTKKINERIMQVESINNLKQMYLYAARP